MAVIIEARGVHDRFVFTYFGRPVRYANGSAFKRALKQANIENFRWHDLRHTWASWHAQSGTPLYVLKELGGWESMEMVQRYAHLASEHTAPFASNIEWGTKKAHSNVSEFKR